MTVKMCKYMLTECRFCGTRPSDPPPRIAPCDAHPGGLRVCVDISKLYEWEVTSRVVVLLLRQRGDGWYVDLKRATGAEVDESKTDCEDCAQRRADTYA